MTRLDDRVVWITGASSGIGAALAKAAAARGARVVLSARRAEALAAVRDRCKRPEAHLVLPLDVTEPAAFAPAHRQVVEAMGPLDVLVLNSGVTQRALVVDTDPQVYRDLMEVNFFGAVGLTQAVLPSMLERGAGHVVAISSVAGKVGTPLRSGYAAAKHALEGFMDALRAEVHDQGVRVTVVEPGFIKTGISLRALGADGSAHGVMERGQERGMAPERCAAAILDAVERERAVLPVGGRELGAIYLQRWAPALLRRLLRRVDVT